MALFLLIRNRNFFLAVLEVGEAKIEVPAHSVSGDGPLSSVLTLAIVQLLAPVPGLVNGGNGFFVCLLACFSDYQDPGLFHLRYLPGVPVTPNRLLGPGR